MAAINRDVQVLIDAGRKPGATPFEAQTPAQNRINYTATRLPLQPPPDPVAESRDVTIAVPGGEIALRAIRGAGTSADETLPCLVFFHGGGWVVGDLDSHDGLCRRLALEAGCCVIAVDYRLAPEHPFPAAVEDCAAALRWAVDHAEALRIDTRRIAVGGDSAGGNLAAVMALMARDGTVPAVFYQLLFYPAVDLSPIDPGFERTTPGVPLSGAGMRYFIDHYLPDAKDRVDWRASPLRAPSLKGVAAAFVLTCGHDPLCEEGRLYAARLEREGVAVTALHLSDQTHGILNMAKLIGAASGVIAYAASALRQAWR